MHKYQTLIYWSDDDQCYIAEVPDLPGCLAHGKTDVEALQNSKGAIELWISTAMEFGDPIPAPSSPSLKIR
ncbi:MAG: type II toxin-antitoxin system HicB family antitoxin [Pseudomonadota bacterium]|nr:type II toxin-antitoxin system HicB family antitoxin [Pseudomonadota bacterium]